MKPLRDKMVPLWSRVHIRVKSTASISVVVVVDSLGGGLRLIVSNVDISIYSAWGALSQRIEGCDVVGNWVVNLCVC